MEQLLYSILLFYFVIGALLTFLTNRRKSNKVKRDSWIKYIVYLIIINILFLSILLKNNYFIIISFLIVFMGFSELIYHTIKSNKTKFGLIIIFLFLPISYFFIIYSYNDSEYLFYSLFVITVFDAFSQLSGQLFGRKKILPNISPNKTYKGFFGGLFMGITTSVLIKDLLDINYTYSIILGFGISISAFAGDLTASYVKRKFGIKDYSHLLPGQGGFLDRFDSLILGNTFTLLILPYL